MPKNHVPTRRFLEAHKYPSPYIVFEKMPYVLEDHPSRPTQITERQADEAFDHAMMWVGYKRDAARKLYRRLHHLGRLAKHGRRCILYSRDGNEANYDLKMKLIAATVAAGLFKNYVSSPGNPRMSRLLPTDAFKEAASADPWEIVPNKDRPLVRLFARATRNEATGDKEKGMELKVDLYHPAVKKYQKRLKVINKINSLFKITYQAYDTLFKRYEPERIQIRPILFASFTDDYEHHGRLYTEGDFGHQGLSKIERAKIRFNGRSSVELDYGGLHTRMLYHQEGLFCVGDPYALWPRTTPKQRMMAKVCINAMINADTITGAVSACNNAMSTKKWNGDRKTGKELEAAQALYSVFLQSGLKFKDVANLALRHHYKIAHRLNRDAGIRLMHLDSEIALDVLYHFARINVPCLSCHDSFIVPSWSKAELKKTMDRAYFKLLGFYPAIKE